MSKKNKWRYSSFRILGWIFGGLSLLNLIEELSPLKLLGKIETWVNAYSELVSKINQVLFGWVDWKWISISDTDSHFLVLALILCSAMFKGGFIVLRRQSNTIAESVWFSFLGATIYVFLPILCIVLLVPGVYGVILSSIATLISWSLLGVGDFVLLKTSWSKKLNLTESCPAIRAQIVGVLIVGYWVGPS